MPMHPREERMRTHATLVLPDGTRRVVGPGDLIGRLADAAVHLDDGRVSEAHALVSLRGSELQLLALRGRFAVDGRSLDRVALAPGLAIHLARDLVLTVAEVSLGDGVPAIEGDGLARALLPNVASLWVDPPRLVPRFESGAPIHLWSTGAAWRARVDGGPVRALFPGEVLTSGGRRFRIVQVDLEAAAQRATVREGELHDPITLTTHFDVVHVARADAPVLVLTGLTARMICELAEVRDPVDWEPLARELWEDLDRDELRRRWDLTLARMRRKLRTAGFRQDLVRSDGLGKVQLLLYPGDRVEARD